MFVTNNWCVDIEIVKCHHKWESDSYVISYFNRKRSQFVLCFSSTVCLSPTKSLKLGDRIWVCYLVISRKFQIKNLVLSLLHQID